MRQIQIQVRREAATRVLQLAEEHKAFSPVAMDAESPDGAPNALVMAHLPNDRVGAFVWAIREEVQDAWFTLLPQGAITIQTPLDEIQSLAREVKHLSTLELVLGSLQSIGSWRGMLLYALFSGVIAAYGVIVNSSFLLVAAMLIAPMGAPAMVSVVGAAVGDWRMVGRGTLRFVAALAVLVVSAMLLGLGYGLVLSTATMEQVTALSRWGVLVALVAGAAGAQSEAESSRASLVTGTATGFLIAAALSPTSAVLGLSVVLRRWDYTMLMSFQLVLQYVAIVTGGWLSLRQFGVTPADPSAERGSGKFRNLIVAALALATIGMAAWQAQQGVLFRKADASVEALELTRAAVRTVPEARLLEANAHFTRSDIEGVQGEAMMVITVIENRSDPGSSDAVEAAVREAVVRRIRSEIPGVTPFVAITVVPGVYPRSDGGGS